MSAVSIVQEAKAIRYIEENGEKPRVPSFLKTCKFHSIIHSKKLLLLCLYPKIYNFYSSVRFYKYHIISFQYY